MYDVYNDDVVHLRGIPLLCDTSSHARTLLFTVFGEFQLRCLTVTEINRDDAL